MAREAEVRERAALRKTQEMELRIHELELERQSGWKRKGRARVLQEAAEARNARDPKHVRKRERQAKRRKKKR